MFQAGWPWLATTYIKKNIFINNMTWAIPSLRSEKFRKPEPPEKRVSFGKCDFSWAYAFPWSFGQQVPKSPVSQLQNGVSTSSPPPLILD